MNQENFIENQKMIVKAMVSIATLAIISIMSLWYEDPHILWAWILTPIIVVTIKR